MILRAWIILSVSQIISYGLIIPEDSDFEFLTPQAPLEDKENRWLELLVNNERYVLNQIHPHLHEENKREINFGIPYGKSHLFYNDFPSTDNISYGDRRGNDEDDIFLNSPENPFIENVYPDIDINFEMDKPQSYLYNKIINGGGLGLSNLLRLLNNLETLRRLKTDQTKGNMSKTQNARSGLVEERLKKPIKTSKRFVVSLSIPSIKYGRRRRLKGKRIRTYRNYRRYRPFRIDPTYFLIGIGKR